MKVYIVIELQFKKDCTHPVIMGVFKNKKDAEKLAYQNPKIWANIIEKEVK